MSRKSKKKVSLAKISAGTAMALEMDGPTPDRLAKLPGVTIQQKASGARIAVFAPGTPKPVGQDGIVRINQEPLERLAARRQLDPHDDDRNARLFDAGDRLRQHWYRAGLSGIGSIDWNRSGGGNGNPAWLTPSSEDAAYHRDRFRKARDTMDRDHWTAVFAVCCGEEDLEGIGRRAGWRNHAGATAVALDRLRRGLETVGILFGMFPPRPVNDNANLAALRLAG